jgi:multisubunit Na+/H+ antiporter MnhC subunit
MELMVAIFVGVLTGTGIYLTLRARTFDLVLGLTLLSYAVNLLIFVMGRLTVGRPPILDGSQASTLANYADPLPQALVLTAIVISFAMTALLLVIALRDPRGDRQRSRRRRGAAGKGGAAVNWPHWIIVPVVLPLIAGAAACSSSGERPASRAPCRSARRSCCSAWRCTWPARRRGTVHPYLLGNWPAPFGIALALDRLSALMLVLTAVVAIASVLYARGGGGRGAHDAQGLHYHALFQFQLMGLNGAFLTADLFNLFVFFEVLLIASYGLLLHGGGAARLRRRSTTSASTSPARRCSSWRSRCCTASRAR